jgi:UDP-2-acetamido-2,6-beta-L-arabino-hexul-4-ose reductase
MRVGITGAKGFIGWHLNCFLRTRENVLEIRTADRNTFLDASSLENFVNGLDLIVHLAGVNRADDDLLLSGNIEPAKQLVNALETTSSTPCVIYSSTTHAVNPSNVYGEAKVAVSETLISWAARNGSRFINLIIPHVFGEYGRPFYNSGVTTFCHQVVKGDPISVNPEGKLELIHVQDLVEFILSCYGEDKSGNVLVHGVDIGVPDIVGRLQALYHQYKLDNQIPDLSDSFTRSLFNTLRSAIPFDEWIRSPQKHADDRGWLVETVKAHSGGQCFVSTTKPGITRGNHYHRRKVERFFVLQGKAKIRLRKLLTGEVVECDLDGSFPSFVDIPTLHTHSITNVGDDELITLFWTDEFFNPDSPDTYFEEVVQ